MSRTLEVEHLGRVEGHGAFTVVLDGPQVARVEFHVFEGLRLFERLVLGHRFDEVPAIVSRVCSICSHAHAIVAVAALEDALGVTPSPRTALLRELALHGGNIESHALHAFALALPDFLRLPGLAELAREQPAATALALRLKKLGNTIQEVVGGRAVHPVTYVPGGFTAEPPLEALTELQRQLTAALTTASRRSPSGAPSPCPWWDGLLSAARPWSRKARPSCREVRCAFRTGPRFPSATTARSRASSPCPTPTPSTPDIRVALTCWARCRA